MKKKYYRLSEAAELLSSRHGHRLTDFDILEMGARGEIRLCLWCDGEIAKFKKTAAGVTVASGPASLFRGYIAIPHEAIDPCDPRAEFDEAVVVESVGAAWCEPELPPGSPEFYGYCIRPPGEEPWHIPFDIDCGKAVVPASELEIDAKANYGAVEVRRKRAALISELKDLWPEVESDLRHADENGLKHAAKLAEHGIWNLAAAVKWAEERGKLSRKSTLDPLETLNRLTLTKRRS